MKPGWKTSEFWVSLLTAVGGTAAVIAGLPLAPVALIGVGVSTAAYAISRAVVKAQAGDVAGAAAEAVAAADAAAKLARGLQK